MKPVINIWTTQGRFFYFLLLLILSLRILSQELKDNNDTSRVAALHSIALGSAIIPHLELSYFYEKKISTEWTLMGFVHITPPYLTSFLEFPQNPTGEYFSMSAKVEGRYYYNRKKRGKTTHLNSGNYIFMYTGINGRFYTVDEYTYFSDVDGKLYTRKNLITNPDLLYTLPCVGWGSRIPLSKKQHFFVEFNLGWQLVWRVLSLGGEINSVAAYYFLPILTLPHISVRFAYAFPIKK